MVIDIKNHNILSKIFFYFVANGGYITSNSLCHTELVEV